MKKYGTGAAIASFAIMLALAACGGGGSSTATSNNGGSSTNTSTSVVSTPTAAVTLSADQSVFESFVVAPNVSYKIQDLVGQLQLSGAQIAGTDYVSGVSTTLAMSPSKGTQTLADTLFQVDNTLPLPASAYNPTRYLVNGNIVVGSGPNFIQSTYYVGPNIYSNIYATDGQTIVYSVQQSNYSSVPLTGLVSNAPTEFQNFFSVLYLDPQNFNSTTSWASGAAYEKSTSTYLGDTYMVFDNSGTTTGTTPVPVATGRTIASYMATGGLSSSSDKVTYTLANGTVSAINGINTYVAANPRPDTTTTEYRTYYDIGGNVYTGAVIKAGTPAGNTLVYYQVNYSGTGASRTAVYTPVYPNPSNFQLRLNAQAYQSFKSALTF